MTHWQWAIYRHELFKTMVGTYVFPISFIQISPPPCTQYLPNRASVAHCIVNSASLPALDANIAILLHKNWVYLLHENWV